MACSESSGGNKLAAGLAVNPWSARAALLLLSTLLGAAAVGAQAEGHPTDAALPQAPPPNPPTFEAETVPQSSTLSTSSSSSRIEKTAYGIGAPTDKEQLYVEMVNRARADTAAEAQRLSNTSDPDVLEAYAFFAVDLNQFVNDMQDLPPSLPPLAINKQLLVTARLHSRDMFNNAFQGHISSDNPPPPYEPGDSVADRASANGYQYLNVAENVYSYAQSVFHGHAGFEVDWGNGPGGMQDPPGHRLIIHDEAYKEIGVGLVEGTNTVGGNTVGPQIVTQNFGVRAEPSAFITGVAYFDLDGDGFYDIGEGIGGLRVDVEGAAYYAITADSGGYALPVEDGSRTVSFSGLGFSGAGTSATIAAGQNEKIDFTPVYQAPVITGPSAPPIAAEATYTLSGSSGATSLTAEIRQSKSGRWSEGGEGGGSNLIDGTDDSYELQSTQDAENGARSLHLAHDSPAPVPVQSVTLDRTILLSHSSELQFSKRMAIANVDQKLEAQISKDRGETWETVWFDFGDMVDGSDPSEAEFSSVTVPLTAYSGQAVRLRFRFLIEYNHDANPDGQANWFSGSTEGLGVYLDNITITDSLQLGASDLRTLSESSSFTFTPPDDQTYILRARAINNADGDSNQHSFPWGPILKVTGQSPLKSLVLSIDGGTPESLVFGMEQGATKGFDEEWDVRTSPPGAGESGAYFIRTEPESILQTDIIGGAVEAHWSLVVQAADSSPVTVSWASDLGLPEGAQLLLFETNAEGRPLIGGRIDMSSRQQITVRGSARAYYRIHFGFAGDCLVTFLAGAHGTLAGGDPDVEFLSACGMPAPLPPDVSVDEDLRHFIGWSPEIPATIADDFTARAQYSFILTYGSDGHGSIQGESPQSVDPNKDGSAVQAMPDTGYHFQQWSDGRTDNPRSDLNVTADVTVTAQFAINSYTIAFEPGAYGTLQGGSPDVSVQANHGTAFPSPPEVLPDSDWLPDGWDPALPDTVTGPLTSTATYRPDYLWKVRFQVADASPQSLAAGMVSGATQGPDADVDSTLAVPHPDDAAAYFYRAASDAYFQKDIIGKAVQGEWFLTVQAGSDADVALSWSFPAPLPEGRHLTLYEVDAEHVPVGESALNMAVQKEHSVPAGTSAFFVLHYQDHLLYDLVLQPEWNLISLPIEARETAVDVLFDSSRYRAESERDSSAGVPLYSGQIWGHESGTYTAVKDLHALQAVWIFANQQAALLIPGAPPSCAALDVPAGWSLLGTARTGPLPEHRTLTPYAWIWNAQTQEYKQTVQLLRGRGHWIHARAPLTLSGSDVCN